VVGVIDVRSPACGLFGVHELRCDGTGSTFVQRGVPVGLWSLGWLGVVADEAAGRPLIRYIPQGTLCPNISLHLDLVQPPAGTDGSKFTARGKVARVGDRVTLTEFVIDGETGTPLVVGSMRNVRLPTAYVPTADVPTALLSDGADPDPSATAAGLPDLGSLLGAEVEMRDVAGRAVLSWAPETIHANPVGSVHGGVHVALADVALSAAVTGKVDQGDWTMIGVDMAYHRSIRLDGGPVSVTAAVLHAGRTSAVAECAIREADSRLLTTARATFVRAM
jgi:uncharacterized protein (TIGR00369 family)